MTKKEIPLFDHPIIETHCHLDYLKDKTIDELIEMAHLNGVEKIITISVDPENLDQAYNIASSNNNVFCSQGIHPHEAKKFNQQTLDKIKERLELKSNKIVAVGEIGLDYHYNHSPKDKQIEVFEIFLNLACEYNLPVVIHSRDADEDMMSILNNFQSKMKMKGVIHSFTSGVELAKKALDWGFHLGFNGIITFKNAQNVRDIVELTPLDKMLIETDAPFLTPAPFRGRENAPHYLPLVAQKISEIKQVPVNELLPILYQNSHDLFSLKSL